MSIRKTHRTAWQTHHTLARRLTDIGNNPLHRLPASKLLMRVYAPWILSARTSGRIVHRPGRHRQFPTPFGHLNLCMSIFLTNMSDLCTARASPSTHKHACRNFIARYRVSLKEYPPGEYGEYKSNCLDCQGRVGADQGVP